MNERIKELAILARKFATSRDPFDEYDVSFDETKFEQKFAELIVKECADIAKHNVMNISTYADAEFVDEQIKQHFVGTE